MTYKLLFLGVFMTFTSLFAQEKVEQPKNWRFESHFMIGREDVGNKILGLSVSRKILNIFSAYGEVDLMPDDDVFSKQRINAEGGIKARVETSMGLYLSAGTGLAMMSSRGYGLASRWQLPNTLEAGLFNNLGSIGFIFKHFSNGTSSYKNSGRNYIGFQVGHAF